MKDPRSLGTILFNNIHIHAQLLKGMEKMLISSGAILKPGYIKDWARMINFRTKPVFIVTWQWSKRRDESARELVGLSVKSSLSSVYSNFAYRYEFLNSD